MSRLSDSLAWGIRGETVERVDGTPLYGALMPEKYAPTLRSARVTTTRDDETQQTLQ